MHKFAELLHRLYFTYSNKEKMVLLKNYFATTPDPDRGYALAIIAGNINFKFYKPSMVHDLIEEYIDPVLYSYSYDYVGDISETVALLWPGKNTSSMALPKLSDIIETFSASDKTDTKNYLRTLMSQANANERWALIKLGTGALRIGISARFLKQTLAQYGGKNIHEIEEVWHALQPPYRGLFAWLEDKATKPNLENQVYFHPVMLSHPIDEIDLSKLTLSDFIAEWKYDGIRVQLVSTTKGKALYSRSGDDISHSFPDVLNNVPPQVVLDGELVIKNGDAIGSFNMLQQRLNRKKPNKTIIQESPGHIILYDALFINYRDLRHQPLLLRRKYLEEWFNATHYSQFSLSKLLTFETLEEMKSLRMQIIAKPHIAIEGLMLKHKDSMYIPGRPTGQWYKWKRDPFIIDAVLMYAQRGSGKRSSFYSDYTFGLWHENQLLPVGKAYFGFTDAELKELDKWIRHHTFKKFGPVREVEKKLVLEIAFDAVQISTRHKSGYALRFPRINRIRWDKPAQEADQVAVLTKLVNTERDDKW